MVAQLFSTTLVGLDARFVRVEAELAPGLPGFHLVGLPDASVAESVHRVRSALRSAGYTLPAKRVTVNLAPGDLRKQGSRFDLAIALAILAADERFPAEVLEDALVLGELGLDGSLRPVRGLVSTALAMRGRLRRLVLPVENRIEIAGIDGLEWVAAASLSELLGWLRGEAGLPERTAGVAPPQAPATRRLDLVVGQPLGRRALEVAAAGGHHLLWLGPPGCGKTMLSECLPEILPALEEEQALEVASVQSALGAGAGLPCRPPLARPHSRISAAALLGHLLPGEVSRAHHGVLFLDELPEFRRDCLEGLRTALESGWVEVGRARLRYRYPARFQLLAACNPCPCGYYGDGLGTCRCSESRRRAYLGKISGPIRDRLDLQVYLDRPPARQVWEEEPERAQERLEAVRSRVEGARLRQRERGLLNRDLSRDFFLRPGQWSPQARWMLEDYAERRRLSVRAMERVARVSRTLADLDDSAGIHEEQIGEALQLRCLDRWQADPSD